MGAVAVGIVLNLLGQISKDETLTFASLAVIAVWGWCFTAQVLSSAVTKSRKASGSSHLPRHRFQPVKPIGVV